MTPPDLATSIRRIGPTLLMGVLLGLMAFSLPSATASAQSLRDQSLPEGSVREARNPAVDAPSPLRVELSSITPATIPKRGPITLTGSVRNDSGDSWSSVNVYPFISHSAMTTRPELDEALDTDAAAVVGSRFYGSGVFSQVGDLEPGQSASFSLAIPRRALPISGQPGVYWIGAHALGASPDGMDSVADGRARTFITLAPKRTPVREVALAMPVRANFQRTPDGRLASESRWGSLLSPGGRLDRIESLAAQAPEHRVNLVVDPAVLDAAAAIAAGNPPASLGDTITPSQPTTDLNADASRDAAAWLSRMSSLAARQDIWSLPYADPDVVALARWRPDLLTTAKQLAKTSLAAHKITAAPILAPTDGLVDPGLLSELAPDPLLLSDQSAGEDLTAADYATSAGPHLIFADQDISDGGPAPTSPYDALAMRQLILAASYLQGSDPDIRPLVVTLPRLWDPGTGWEAADFFAGLSQPWLKLTSLPRSSSTNYNARLSYDAADEVGSQNVQSATSVVRAAHTLTELLATNNDASVVFTGAALAATSYDARVHPKLARDATDAAGRFIGDQLDKVEVTGSNFVTLSGGSGPVSVSIVNGMSSPITVGLRPVTASSKIKVSTPKPVTLGPGQRASVKVEIDTNTVGVQQIALIPVTGDGTRIASAFTFNLRTSQVGRLIWVIMVAGAALLVIMIGRRIVRRIRTNTWELDETEANKLPEIRAGAQAGDPGRTNKRVDH